MFEQFKNQLDTEIFQEVPDSTRNDLADFLDEFWNQEKENWLQFEEDIIEETKLETWVLQTLMVDVIAHNNKVDYLLLTLHNKVDNIDTAKDLIELCKKYYEGFSKRLLKEIIWNPNLDPAIISACIAFVAEQKKAEIADEMSDSIPWEVAPFFWPFKWFIQFLYRMDVWKKNAN